MLVLSRKKEEALVIGDDIVIKVVRIGADRVQLGITAPKHISINRQEVQEKIAQKGAEGGQISDASAAQ